MIDITKKYKTRDGREVRIYATDGGSNTRPRVHGAVEESSKNWCYYEWHADGRFWDSTPSYFDLIEVKPRIQRTVWLSVYPDFAAAHSDEQATKAAVEAALPFVGRPLACVEVKIDCAEGEGLGDD